jgi:putative alpha-1,2-mannosidase
MAKAVADTLSPAENAAGFVSDSNPVIGFSHLHDSGTGGSPSMGNFPIFVHPGCPEDNFTMCKYIKQQRATSRVEGSAMAGTGYFTINLTNSVRAEMTAAEHTALYRFSFPGTPTVSAEVDPLSPDGGKTVQVPYSPLVLIDLLDLANSRSIGGIQVYPDTQRMVGEGKFGASFGQGNYAAYFCADFRGAKVRRSGTFKGNVAAEEPKFLDSMRPDYSIPSGSVGTWMQFEKPDKGDTIMARVGLSFMSVDKACENAEREVPDFDFERVEFEAQNAWAEKLSVIEVDSTGVSDDMLTTFWSGLYRTMLSPQNYTGENPYWNSTEPYFDS